jgi:uncharacterized protein involved in exopolysaccharide biosynthesis
MAMDEFDDLEASGGMPDFLRDPIGIPGRRWLWMLLALIVGLASTGALALLQKAVYRSSATILVTSQQMPEDFVRTTVTEDPFSRLNAMLSTVLSREKLLEMIDTHGLYLDLREQVPMETVINIMRQNIEITPGTGLGKKRRASSNANSYEIAFRSDTPDQAADVANNLATLFLEGGMQSRMDHAIGIKNFMRKELERTEQAERAVSKEISDFKEANRGRLPEELESNLRRLERLQSHHASLASRIAVSENRLAVFNVAPESGPAAPESPEARLARLKIRYEHETSVKTAKHPTVIALKRELADLEAAVAKEQNQSPTERRENPLARAEMKNVEMLRQEMLRTQEQMAEVDELVKTTPTIAGEFEALEHRASVLRDKYLEFLRKVSEAEMAQSLEAAQYGSRVTIIDRAQPPGSAQNSRTKILVLGIVASLALSCGLGLALEFFDPVVVSRDQIESITGLPVLGSAPRLV